MRNYKVFGDTVEGANVVKIYGRLAGAVAILLLCARSSDVDNDRAESRYLTKIGVRIFVDFAIRADLYYFARGSRQVCEGEVFRERSLFAKEANTGVGSFLFCTEVYAAI